MPFNVSQLRVHDSALGTLAITRGEDPREHTFSLELSLPLLWNDESATGARLTGDDDIDVATEFLDQLAMTTLEPDSLDSDRPGCLGLHEGEGVRTGGRLHPGQAGERLLKQRRKVT